MNCNKTDSFFNVNAAQYTTYYKNNWTLANLPVRAHFDSTKYQKKSPLPSNNTYVAVEGFLGDIEKDTARHIMLLHMSVNNINFLGRVLFSPLTPTGVCPFHLSPLGMPRSG